MSPRPRSNYRAAIGLRDKADQRAIAADTLHVGSRYHHYPSPPQSKQSERQQRSAGTMIERRRVLHCYPLRDWPSGVRCWRTGRAMGCGLIQV
jgi:hypothetical protein